MEETGAMSTSSAVSPKQNYRSWIAFVLNVIPLPVGLGYLYVSRRDLAAYSVFVRLSTVLIVYLLTYPLSYFVLALTGEGLDTSGAPQAVRIYWLFNITVNAVALMVAGVHAFRLSMKKSRFYASK